MSATHPAGFLAAPHGRLRAVAVVVSVAGLIGGLWLLRPPAPPPPVAVSVPRVIGLGAIEPASAILRLGAPGNPDAVRLASLLVAEGEVVEAGQVLAVLDSAEKLAVQLAAAEAQARLRRLLRDRQRHEVAHITAVRQAALARTRAELDSTRAEFDRQSTLAGLRVAAQATMEQRRASFLAASAAVDEAQAGLARIAAADGVVQIDLAVAEQELAVAEAEVAVARAALDLAAIRAPFAGRVLAVRSRPGERIGSDGVLEFGDTSRMRAIVEVYQSDVARLRPGQTVFLRADVLGDRVEGTVARIGWAVKRQTVVNNEPSSATDARVIEVTVALDAAASARLSGLSRLQVIAEFQP